MRLAVWTFLICLSATVGVGLGVILKRPDEHLTSTNAASSGSSLLILMEKEEQTPYHLVDPALRPAHPSSGDSSNSGSSGSNIPVEAQLPPEVEPGLASEAASVPNATEELKL